jgi:hypothetical protein
MPTTELAATAAPETGSGRELQQLCRFYDDLSGRDYRCTLSEYCAVLAEASNKTIDYTCVGDLNGEFSITYQQYVCLDPQTNSSWIQADDIMRVCYNETDRTDFFRYTSRWRTGGYDFDVGFNFHLTSEASLCSDDGTKQCSCTVSIEGRPCQSCAVCQNGYLSVQANAYLYDLDCSNLADGMTRTCDESFSWGEFFQIVEDLGVPPPPAASAASSPTTTSTGGSIPPISSVNNKGLSSAALGGIIGAAVGVVLAGLFAIILIVALRAGKKRGGTGRSDTGDHPGDRGGDRAGGAVVDDRPMAEEESSNRNDHGGSALPYPAVPMADAVLLDPAISGLGVTRPFFKDQVNP